MHGLKPRSHRACDGLRWSAMVGSWSIVDHHGASWSPSCVDVRFCGHRRLESQLLKCSKDALRWSASYDRRRSSCDRRTTVVRCRGPSHDGRTTIARSTFTFQRRTISHDVAGRRATSQAIVRRSYAVLFSQTKNVTKI